MHSDRVAKWPACPQAVLAESASLPQNNTLRCSQTPSVSKDVTGEGTVFPRPDPEWPWPWLQAGLGTRREPLGSERPVSGGIRLMEGWQSGANGLLPQCSVVGGKCLFAAICPNPCSVSFGYPLVRAVGGLEATILYQNKGAKQREAI